MGGRRGGGAVVSLVSAAVAFTFASTISGPLRGGGKEEASADTRTLMKGPLGITRFAHEEALREIRRVLKPGGKLGVIWNIEECAFPFSLSTSCVRLSRICCSPG